MGGGGGIWTCPGEKILSIKVLKKGVYEYWVWQQGQEKHVLGFLEMRNRFRFTCQKWKKKKNSSLSEERKLLFPIHQPVISQKQTSSQYLIWMICVLFSFTLQTGLRKWMSWKKKIYYKREYFSRSVQNSSQEEGKGTCLANARQWFTVSSNSALETLKLRLLVFAKDNLSKEIEYILLQCCHFFESTESHKNE